MTWTAQLSAVACDLLADLYPALSDALRVATKAGLSRSRIAQEPMAQLTWLSILEEARRQQQVSDLLDVVLAEQPRNSAVRALRAQCDSGVTASLPSLPAPPIAQIPWRGPTSRGELEAMVSGEPTLVGVAWLSSGLRCARAVARIEKPSGASGSGFLSRWGDRDVLVTNHHVVSDPPSARDVSVQVNVQKDEAGCDTPMEEYRLDPDAFFRTSPIDEDDWTAVAVVGDPSARWGHLPLEDAAAKEGARVNVIGHPGGGPKMMSYFHNTVVFAGAGRVQYLTDTIPGSSGSPVFDKDWRVVALHQSGGWMVEPDATGKNPSLRNQGIDIRRVLDGLKR